MWSVEHMGCAYEARVCAEKVSSVSHVTKPPLTHVPTSAQTTDANAQNMAHACVCQGLKEMTAVKAWVVRV